MADCISAQVAEVATVGDDLPDLQSVREPAAQLAIMARRPSPQNQDTVLHTTTASAEKAGQATALTLQSAKTLLNAARKRPADFSTLARVSRLAPEEVESVLVGEIPPTLWRRLAEQALNRVIQPS